MQQQHNVMLFSQLKRGRKENKILTSDISLTVFILWCESILLQCQKQKRLINPFIEWKFISKETALKSGLHYFAAAIRRELRIHEDCKRITVNEARRQSPTNILWMFVSIITECEGRAAYDILWGTGFELCTGYECHILIQSSNAKELQNL